MHGVFWLQKKIMVQGAPLINCFFVSQIILRWARRRPLECCPPATPARRALGLRGIYFLKNWKTRAPCRFQKFIEERHGMGFIDEIKSIFYKNYETNGGFKMFLSFGKNLPRVAVFPTFIYFFYSLLAKSKWGLLFDFWVQKVNGFTFHSLWVSIRSIFFMIFGVNKKVNRFYLTFLVYSWTVRYGLSSRQKLTSFLMRLVGKS